MYLIDRFVTLDADPYGLLSIYLNDHRAGAEGASALTARCARSNADNDVGAYLTGRFLPELRIDRARLEAVRAGRGVGDNPFKQWSARLGAFVGQLKTNGALTGYSPLSRVVELELLISGVVSKRQLWQTLATVSGSGAFDDDIERADDQIDRLVHLHRWAVGEAFPAVSLDGVAPPDGCVA